MKRAATFVTPPGSGVTPARPSLLAATPRTSLSAASVRGHERRGVVSSGTVRRFPRVSGRFGWVFLSPQAGHA